MVSHVKTTPNIDATVMQRVREEAARRGTTISALVEAGLRRLLEVEPAAAIEYNQLSGEIPAELGQLKNIDGAELSGNQFVGCIPRGVRAGDLEDLGLPNCEDAE